MSSTEASRYEAMRAHLVRARVTVGLGLVFVGLGLGLGLGLGFGFGFGFGLALGMSPPVPAAGLVAVRRVEEEGGEEEHVARRGTCLV